MVFGLSLQTLAFFRKLCSRAVDAARIEPGFSPSADAESEVDAFLDAHQNGLASAEMFERTEIA